jgi:hypothetical protein
MSQLGSHKRIFAEDVTDDMMQKAFEVAHKAFGELKPGMTVNASASESIRDEFNRIYGKSWNCVVGKDFGAFVTHCTRTYVFFYVLFRFSSYALFSLSNSRGKTYQKSSSSLTFIFIYIYRYMYFSIVPGVSVLLWRTRMDSSPESKDEK